MNQDDVKFPIIHVKMISAFKLEYIKQNNVAMMQSRNIRSAGGGLSAGCNGSTTNTRKFFVSIHSI